jgi:hypothetical protein
VPSPSSKIISMRDAKDIFGKISQTNHYVVSFSALNNAVVNHISRKFGVSDARDFVSRKSGLLCSEAVLPASGYATAQVKGDFMINPGSDSGSKSNKKPTSKPNPVAKPTPSSTPTGPIPLEVNPYREYGNTYGPNSEFIPRDSATGVPI